MAADVPFMPILLGADESAYGMARSFYEEYQTVCVALDQQVYPICKDSKIVRAKAVPGFRTEAVFADALDDFARQVSGYDGVLLLIPTENVYTRLLARCTERLRERYRFCISPAPLVEQLAVKSSFYQLCEEQGVPYPAYEVVPPVAAADESSDAAAQTSEAMLAQAPFDFPMVFKPDDPDAFDDCSFRGRKNAYELRNRSELDYGRSMLKAAGYAGDFLIQQQVPGADDSLRTFTCYSDHSGRVRLVAQGDVVLEQAAPWNIGRFGAVVAGHDEALAQQVASLLRSISYRGFCSIDVKMNEQTGACAFIDFNVAPRDVSYLATLAGQNLARFIVEDVVAGESDSVEAPTDDSAGFAQIEPDSAMLTKVPASTLRQYARKLGVWERVEALMSAHRCRELFTPDYDQSFLRWKAHRSDQHFHRREFADCYGRIHVNN